VWRTIPTLDACSKTGDIGVKKPQISTGEEGIEKGLERFANGTWQTDQTDIYFICLRSTYLVGIQQFCLLFLQHLSHRQLEYAKQKWDQSSYASARHSEKLYVIVSAVLEILTSPTV